MIYKFFAIISFLIIMNALSAQVKINEYSASNSGTSILDNQGNNSDWIELFNASSLSINAGGWTLSDDPANLTKYSLPAGTNVPARARLKLMNTVSRIHPIKYIF